MFWLGKVHERFVLVWQKFYSDYSILVKFTNFLQHSAQQKACLALTHWKLKLQSRQPVSTNERWIGNYCLIFKSKGSVFCMLVSSEAAQSFAGISLEWYMWRVCRLTWKSYHTTWLESCHCSLHLHFWFCTTQRDWVNDCLRVRCAQLIGVGVLFAMRFALFDVL